MSQKTKKASRFPNLQDGLGSRLILGRRCYRNCELNPMKCLRNLGIEGGEHALKNDFWVCFLLLLCVCFCIQIDVMNDYRLVVVFILFTIWLNFGNLLVI